jgi:hypothetical protein
MPNAREALYELLNSIYADGWNNVELDVAAIEGMVDTYLAKY